MQVVFRDAEGKTIGSVTLANGRFVYRGRAKVLLRDLTVLKPDNPRHKLTAANGGAWLRAIPFEFRSGYLTAEFIE